MGLNQIPFKRLKTIYLVVTAKKLFKCAIFEGIEVEGGLV